MNRSDTNAIEKLAQQLFDKKYKKDKVYFNSKKIHEFGQKIIELFYPQLGNHHFKSPTEVENHLEYLRLLLQEILTNIELKNGDLDLNKDRACKKFFAKLPELEELITQDAEAICEGDPAATNIDEVITCYPGFKAIALYRLANTFYAMEIPILPRILSEFAHQRTGIDIHPGASIGHHFCIDHGTGIVIGETSEIGNYVKIYQGVTLGALSVEKKFEHTKRHPTIGNKVVIYAGATILGGKTVIGDESIIGGNTWVIKSVAPKSVVYRNTDIQQKKE